MIVGLDVDQTITRHPEFFALLSRALVEASHQVVIITFRDDRESTEQQLNEWDICWTTLVTLPKLQDLTENPDAWKAGVCRQLGVDILFDDDPAVLAHVDAQVVCLMPVDPHRSKLPRPYLAA